MQTAFGTLTPSLVVALVSDTELESLGMCCRLLATRLIRVLQSGVETGPYFQRLLDIGLPLEPPLSVLSDSPIGIPLLTAARAMRSDPPKHTRQQISILANMDRRCVRSDVQRVCVCVCRVRVRVPCTHTMYTCLPCLTGGFLMPPLQGTSPPFRLLSGDGVWARHAVTCHSYCVRLSPSSSSCV